MLAPHSGGDYRGCRLDDNPTMSTMAIFTCEPEYDSDIEDEEALIARARGNAAMDAIEQAMSEVGQAKEQDSNVQDHSLAEAENNQGTQEASVKAKERMELADRHIEVVRQCIVDESQAVEAMDEDKHQETAKAKLEIHKADFRALNAERSALAAKAVLAETVEQGEAQRRQAEADSEAERQKTIAEAERQIKHYQSQAAQANERLQRREREIEEEEAKKCRLPCFPRKARQSSSTSPVQQIQAPPAQPRASQPSKPSQQRASQVSQQRASRPPPAEPVPLASPASLPQPIPLPSEAPSVSRRFTVGDRVQCFGGPNSGWVDAVVVRLNIQDVQGNKERSWPPDHVAPYQASNIASLHHPSPCHLCQVRLPDGRNVFVPDDLPSLVRASPAGTAPPSYQPPKD